MYLQNCIRDTAMSVSDIVENSEGCLSPYNVLSQLYHYRIVNMAAWKPEVHFRKSVESRVPGSKSPN